MELPEVDSRSTPSSTSVLDMDAFRSAASSTPPTSLTSGPSDVADAPKEEQPQQEIEEPRRSGRARSSVGTYNLATLVGTNIHTPTKYLLKNGERTVSGDTLVDKDNVTPVKTEKIFSPQLRGAFDTDWHLDAMPGDALRRTLSAPVTSKGLGRRSSRLSLVTSATSNAVHAASSALGKRARDALESGKNALKTLATGPKLSRAKSRLSMALDHDSEPTSSSPAKRRRTDASPTDTDLAEPDKKLVVLPKKRKAYLDHGLYVGQVRDVKASQKRAKKYDGSNKEVFPSLPMFSGEKLLEVGRDFKLPFDVFSPQPRKTKKPENWTNMRQNRAFGEAIDLYKQICKEDASTCACTPARPCSRDDSNACLNFIMGYECDEKNCILGSLGCKNRPFGELEERNKRGNEYDIGVEIMETADRGYGIRSNRCFKPGQIIMEYTGEVITQSECNRRMHKEYKNNKCYYLMTFDNKLIVDATMKGNMTRFVNHSCDPNCEMIKMMVKGRPRMALFAGAEGIVTGEELTYDYNFEAFSDTWSQQCLCGAATCRGVLGPKPKEARVPKVKEIIATKVKSLKRKAKEIMGDDAPSTPKKRKTATKTIRVSKTKVSIARSKTIQALATKKAALKGKAKKSQAKGSTTKGSPKSSTASKKTNSTKSSVTSKKIRVVKSKASIVKASRVPVKKGIANKRETASKGIGQLASGIKKQASKVGPASEAYAKRRLMGAKAKGLTTVKAKRGVSGSSTAPLMQVSSAAMKSDETEEQIIDQIIAEAARAASGQTAASSNKTKGKLPARRVPSKKTRPVVTSIRGPRKQATLERFGIQSTNGKQTMRVVGSSSPEPSL